MRKRREGFVIQILEMRHKLFPPSLSSLFFYRLSTVAGGNGGRLAEQDAVVTVEGLDGQLHVDVGGGRGLDEHASSDRGVGGIDGAGQASSGSDGAQVLVVCVDNTAEELARDGELGGGNDVGQEGTSARGAHVLVNAERVGRDGEGVDDQVGGARGSTIGDNWRLGPDESSESKSGDGGEEFHGGGGTRRDRFGRLLSRIQDQ